MEVTQKIELARYLNDEIVRLREFVKLLKDSDWCFQWDTKKKNKVFSLTISCQIRTGDQSVNCKKYISDHPTILSCISITELETAIEEKTKQLEGLFTSNQSYDIQTP